MAETQQLTEHQRAAMVARFVEVQEISMLSIEAKLLSPKARLANSEAYEFNHDKKATHFFDEEKRVIGVILDLATEISSTSAGNDGKIARFAGSYILIYSFNASGGPPPEERDAFFSAFANINAVFNAWPFFRELVHSALGRMGLQPLALPVYRITPPAQPPAVQAPPMGPIDGTDPNRPSIPKTTVPKKRRSAN